MNEISDSKGYSRIMRRTRCMPLSLPLHRIYIVYVCRVCMWQHVRAYRTMPKTDAS